MDIQQFDALTRALARRLTRRTTVASAAVVGAAAVMPDAGQAKTTCSGQRKSTKCKGKCVNVRTDKRNCGKCGKKCAAGESCRRGKCKSTGAKACGTGGDCLVFVTSQTFDGNLGDVTGANDKCSLAAAAAELPGPTTYKAWLSSTSLAPADTFFQNPEPYVLVDGTVVAADWAELTGGTLQAPISRTELNTVVTGQVWTNTLPAGTVADTFAGDVCINWTDNQGRTITTGASTATDGTWTRLEDDAECDSLLRLYCFQQPA